MTRLAHRIHITVSKTGKRIIIQWTDELRQAVDAARKLKRPVAGLYLFSTRRGQPYSPTGLSSIWQRKMAKAIEQGVLKERFQERDIRRKTGSDSETLADATSLLAHSDSRVTQRHYRAKPEVVKPLK